MHVPKSAPPLPHLCSTEAHTSSAAARPPARDVPATRDSDRRARGCASCRLTHEDAPVKLVLSPSCNHHLNLHAHSCSTSSSSCLLLPSSPGHQTAHFFLRSRTWARPAPYKRSSGFTACYPSQRYTRVCRSPTIKRPRPAGTSRCTSIQVFFYYPVISL